MTEDARRILKSVLGYDRFIWVQEEVISNVLSGRDSFAIIRAGGGKSLATGLRP